MPRLATGVDGVTSLGPGVACMGGGAGVRVTTGFKVVLRASASGSGATALGFVPRVATNNVGGTAWGLETVGLGTAGPSLSVVL